MVNLRSSCSMILANLRVTVAWLSPFECRFPCRFVLFRDDIVVQLTEERERRDLKPAMRRSRIVEVQPSYELPVGGPRSEATPPDADAGASMSPGLIGIVKQSRRPPAAFLFGDYQLRCGV
jgi:hypothetical protein